MAAFLHGVADRNMAVRKSYAMALGHLVRVWVLVLHFTQGIAYVWYYSCGQYNFLTLLVPKCIFINIQLACHRQLL